MCNQESFTLSLIPVTLYGGQNWVGRVGRGERVGFTILYIIW